MDNAGQPPPYTEKGPIDGSMYPPMPEQTPQPAYAPQHPHAPQPVMMAQAPQPVPEAVRIETSGPRGNVIVTTMPMIGKESVRMNCPHCTTDIETATQKDPSLVAWISAFVLFCVGCVCGCCLIPLCMDDCKHVEHTCPQCKRFLGKYSKY